MSGKNKSAYPFYIIAGSLVCLVALSMVRNTFSLQNYTSRPLDMLADVRKEQPADSASLAADIPTDTSASTDPADTVALAGIPDPDHDHDFASYTGILNYAVRDTTVS